MTDLSAELGKLSGISDGDQHSAAVVNIAADVAAYHARLVKTGGMPKALIANLTINAAEHLWGGSGCTCDD